MYRLIVLVGLLVLVGGQVRSAEPDRKGAQRSIVLFTGSGDINPFWRLFTGFMEESAKDLGIEFEVRYANGSPREMLKQVREACQRDKKPDAIVAQSFKKVGPRLLRLANEHEVPVFLVNSGLTDEEKKSVGEPRRKLKYWIGELLPNDYGAGFRLANALIDEARKDPRRIAPDGRVHLIGINGIVSHGASIQRDAGLRDAVAQRSDEAALDQIVAADWRKELARKRSRVLYRRYPDASAIWCASDLMAEGAIQAVVDLGLVPGSDLVVGGVDATEEAMQLIEEGAMCATVGGHFMDGGWAAVLLHDYFHGINIPRHSDSDMTLVIRENLDTYRSLLTRDTWKQIDFHAFSHVRSPKSKKYRFTVDALLTETAPSEPRTSTSDESNRSEVDSIRDQ